jgi:hypothetical protein
MTRSLAEIRQQMQSVGDVERDCSELGVTPVEVHELIDELRIELVDNGVTFLRSRNPQVDRILASVLCAVFVEGMLVQRERFRRQ